MCSGRSSDSLSFVTAPHQPAEALLAAFRHVDEMRAYLVEIVEARRAHLRDDLLSSLIEADEDGDRLTTDEIAAMAMIITAAGHETTTSLLVNAQRLLLGEPATAGRIGEDAAFRRTAIEETLRWEPPLQFSTRITLDDLDSPIIGYDASDEPDDGFAYAYRPRSEPGFRLPHLWRADGTALHDQLAPGYTLLRLGGTDLETARFEKAMQDLGAPLTVLDAGEPHLRERYGADLVLLRPDLHVAWRGGALPAEPIELAELVTGRQPTG